MESARAAEKELARLKAKAAASAGDDLAGSAVDVKGAKVARGDARRRRREGAARDDGQAEGQAQERGDRARQRRRRQGHADRRRHAATSPRKVKAGELVNHVAQQVGGKGGGRPDMAQAGGTNPAALPGGAAVGAGLGRAAPVSATVDARTPSRSAWHSQPQFASDNNAGHLSRGVGRARRRRTAGTRPRTAATTGPRAARDAIRERVRRRLRRVLRVQRHRREFARRSRRCAAAPTRSSATRSRTSTSTSAARPSSSAAARSCSPSTRRTRKLTPEAIDAAGRHAARRALRRGRARWR